MLNQGTFLADRYEIIERVGAGGMSDVYRATDHILERDVAVKVLKQEFAEDQNFVSKFRAEAQSAAGLEHPNIVNIYDVGSEDGLYYIVMEYVEGITLKTYIEKKGHLNYKEVISIAIQVGRGIEAAHNKGIIHRDIKPQNIIISHEGKVKVTDFGIARAASGNTMSADVMGSVHYVSPEQARNGYVTEQSDIYSLGIVMYEMATGRVPFDGETAVAVAIQHLQGEMTPPSQLIEDIPISIEKIILKATQKSPERRYASMEDLLVDLKKALANPNDDFVVMAPIFDSNDKTRVISQDELNELRGVSNEDDYDDEEYDDDYDDEDYDDDEYDEDEEDEDDEDDEDVNPKLEKAITIMGIAAAVIIAIIAIYLIGSFLGWFHFGSSKTTDETTTEEEVETEDEEEGTIEVPSLLGMTEDEAAAALKKLNLGYKVIGTESSSTYDEDLVCNQSPKAGNMVEENSTVKITLSSGVGSIDIPNVIGESQATATSTLQSAGFSVNVEQSASSTVSEGIVISQSPSSSQKGQKGDTVTITVSTGPDEVTVSNVVGATQAAAVAELESHGLKVSVVEEYSNTVSTGLVISQSPAGGNVVSSGTTVTITVSKGAEDVEVPNVVGRTQADATSALQALGFNVSVSTASDYNSSVAAGYVQSQSVSGTKVAYGSTVSLVISIGPKPAETPTDTDNTNTETSTDTSTEGEN